MSEGLEVRLRLTAVLAHRKASSDCHGALLDPGSEPGTFTCQECGRPCQRALSEPQEVTAHG